MIWADQVVKRARIYGVWLGKCPRRLFAEGTPRSRTGHRRSSAPQMQGARAHAAPCISNRSEKALFVLEISVPSVSERQRLSTLRGAAAAKGTSAMLLLNSDRRRPLLFIPTVAYYVCAAHTAAGSTGMPSVMTDQ